MTDLVTRIRDRLEELNKSARRASIEGGLTPDAIRNVLRGISVNPRRDTLAGIAQGLEWSLEELLELAPAEGGSDSSTRLQEVPLISWVAAGDMSETFDPYAVGDAEARIPVGYRRGTLVALRVSGTSMNRVAPDGSIIIVDYADRTLTSGKYYVVKYDGEATFKRFRTEPKRLEPDSTEHHETVFPKAGMEIVGRVVQVITDLS